jgi:hypothetical protein
LSIGGAQGKSNQRAQHEKAIMAHNILLTGVSGYLGGSLLTYINRGTIALPAHGKIYALVRDPQQEEAVKQYAIEPLTFNPYDEQAVRDGIVDNEISIVFFLIDSRRGESQVKFIKALKDVKEKTGKEVHFLHVSSAFLFLRSVWRLTHKTRRQEPRYFPVMLGHRRIGHCWIPIRDCMTFKRNRRPLLRACKM